MELLKYLFVEFLKFMGNMFVIILPIMVALFISTIMNIDIAWSFVIIFIEYIVLFFVLRFIRAIKYMKINNVSAQVAWEKTSPSENTDEYL